MNNKRLKHILILALPLVFKYLLFLVFVDWDVFNAEDLGEDIFFFCIITTLVFSKFFQKVFLKNVVLFIYVFYIILETTSYLAVSSTFSSSYMYLLLESSLSELNEFAGGYFSPKILIAFLIFISLFFYLRRLKFTPFLKYSNLLATSFLFVGVLFLKFTGLIESNAYHNIVRGTYGYYKLQNSIKFETEIDKKDIIVSSENEVLVILLGESTTRNNMQLYGYDRQTTPLLNQIENELFVYNNVISTDVFTLKAVPKILTSLTGKISEDSALDVVRIFKSAGFDTYWLSNQRPISYHDNAISKIASGSKDFKFYNHLIDKNTKVLDEKMLPDYNAILDKPGKKLIVLRLIGTHFDYDNRYPSTYNRFDRTETSSKKAKLINQYDNAVLYNDFIVNSTIEALRQKNQKSALIYLSDHGENIYSDGTDFFGRSEEIITKSMFEIPFFIWTSESFEFPQDFKFDSERKFTSQYTFESLGHLFGVKHKSIDVTNSIFSNTYKPKERIIIGNRNFDTFFKTTTK